MVTITEREISKFAASLEAIESIPDDVLERGDLQELTKYFESKNIHVTFLNEKGEKVRKKRGAWRCALGMTVFVAGTAIPVVKIKKIKDAIDKIGGVTKTLKALAKQKEVGALTEEVAKAVAIIAGELLGFTEVYEECFA
ncbi:ATPase/permease component [Paenibacillus popilliae ATCC 14706]|uniref:ATPase/permease component n=2 Tax=Paenibacillus popilliae TaxID=78057 RepID=M9LHP3_PAEPP|nr:ATPase/permease component [Paenibacillus popilliae ATCC 14706]